MEYPFGYKEWSKYMEMFDAIDKMDTFLMATQIAEAGLPRLTDEIPTCAIGFNKFTKEPIFLFNRDFLMELPIEDLTFAFVHEILHVAFNHIERCLRFGIDNEKDPLRWKLWNIAADCIVNTWAVSLGFAPTKDFFMGKCDEEPDEKTGSCKHHKMHLCTPESIEFPNYGPNTTVEEIFVFLTKKNEEQLKKYDKMMTMDSHAMWSEMKGPGSDEFAEKIAGSIKPEYLKNAQNRDLKDFVKKNNEKNKNSQNPLIKNFKSKGSGALGEIRAYENLRDRIQVDILRRIHIKIKSGIDIRPKETWTMPPKKLLSIWPDALMPYEWDRDDKCLYEALLVIDASGSISDPMIAQMVRMARSFPLDKIRYTPIAFDDAIYELNKAEFYRRDGYPQIPGRGGTNISLAEEYIQTKYVKIHHRRPDIVLVITDGMGNYTKNISEKNQKSYVWIMTKNHSKREIQDYCPGGYVFETSIQ